MFLRSLNHSGGSHQTNYNAFAYHCHLNYDIVDLDTTGNERLYNDHATIVRTQNGNVYMWEFALKVFPDTYNEKSTTNQPAPLTAGKVLGFAVSYNDNDGGTTRESFIGSMDIPGTNKNVAWQNASVFGVLTLGGNTTPTPTSPITPTPSTTVRPTPSTSTTGTPTPTRRGPTPTSRRGSTVTPTPTIRITPIPTRGVNTPTPSRGITGGYMVSYVIQSDWGVGATINVTLTNNGSEAVNGWTLAFTFPGNQTITNLWNGTYTQSGASVSVKDAGFNAGIPANGGSVNFGFNLNYNGTNAKPTSFTLNGAACQVQ